MMLPTGFRAQRRACRRFAPGSSVIIEPLESRQLLALAVFDGGPSGTGVDWHDPVNWVGDVAPVDGDSVQIGAGPSSAVVFQQGSVELAGLTAARPLSVSGGRVGLSAGGTATLAGTTLAGGVLAGGVWNFGSGLTVSGPVGAGCELAGASVRGTVSLAAANAVLRVTGGLLLEGSLTLTGSGSELVFAGTQTFDGAGAGGTIRLGASTARLKGAAAADVLTLGPALVLAGFGQMNGSSRFVNQGVVRADTDGGSLIFVAQTGGQFVNDGRLESAGGTLSFSLTGPIGALSFTGTSGNILLDGSPELTAPVTVPIDRRLQLSGTWHNRTTITVAGGMLELFDTYDNTGAIVLNSGTLSFRGTFTQSQLGTVVRTGGTVRLGTGSVFDNSDSSFTLDAQTGTWLLDGGTIRGGTLHAQLPLIFTSRATNTLENVRLVGEARGVDTAAARLRLRGGLVLDGSLVFPLNPGRLDVDGGVSITTGSSGVISFIGDPPAGSLITHDIYFGNNGVETLTLGAGILLRATSLNPSTFDSQSTATIVNYGVIRADGPGRIWMRDTHVVNHGRIEAVNGGLIQAERTVNGPGSARGTTGRFELRGTMDVGTSSQQLSAAEGTIALEGGTIVGGVWTFADGVRFVGGGGTFRSVTIASDWLVPLRQFSVDLYDVTLNAVLTIESDAGSFDMGGWLAAGPGGRLVLTAPLLSQRGPQIFGSDFTVRPGTTIEVVRGELNGMVVNRGVVRAAGAGSLLTTYGMLDNQGLIEAADGGVVQFFESIGNTGAIRGVTGTVRLVASYDNAGRVLRLDATTGSWELGGTIRGGTVEFADGAGFRSIGGIAKFVDCTLIGDTSLTGVVEFYGFTPWTGDVVFTDAVLRVYGSLQWTGRWDLSHTQVNVFGGIRIDGAVRLMEASAVVLAAPTALDATSRGSIESVSSADPLTNRLELGANITLPAALSVRGGRLLIRSFLSHPSAYTLTLQSTISSDQPGQSIEVFDVILDNEGVFEARNGGTASARLVANYDTTTLTLTGGVWRALAGSSMSLNSGSAVRINNADLEIDATASWPFIRLLKTNNGTLTLTGGAFAFTTASPPMTNNGTLRLGPGVHVALAGNFTQTGAGRLDALIGRGADDPAAPLIAATGTVSIAGTLGVGYTHGYTPAFGVRFDMLTGSSVSGSFTAVDSDPPSELGKSVAIIEPGRVQLLFTSRADIDNSGLTTLGDLFGMLDAYFRGSSDADIDGNGEVSVNDLFEFLAIWFQTRN